MNRKLLMGIVLSFLSGASIEAVCSMESDGGYNFKPVKESWLSYNPDPRDIIKEYDKFVIRDYNFYVAPTYTKLGASIYNTIEYFIPIYNVINFISRKIELEYNKSHYTYNQQKILDNLRGVGTIPNVWGDIKLENRKLDAAVNPDIKIYSKALACIYTAYLYNHCNNNGAFKNPVTFNGLINGNGAFKSTITFNGVISGNDAFENPVAFRDFINKCPDDEGILNNENILKKLCEWGCLTPEAPTL